LIPLPQALLFGAAAGATAFLLYGDSMTSPPQNATEQANLDAFLALIREGESSDNYGALVGGGSFDDFTDHPALRGWDGIVTPNGPSHAAGAYQFQPGTWLSLGGAGRYGDFGQAAQDAAALDLLKRRGAYPLILSGQAGSAAYALRNEWEMFTLPRWSSSAVAARFSELGGTPT
jgi:muramidase (phage lysozyme)